MPKCPLRPDSLLRGGRVWTKFGCVSRPLVTLEARGALRGRAIRHCHTKPALRRSVLAEKEMADGEEVPDLPVAASDFCELHCPAALHNYCEVLDGRWRLVGPPCARDPSTTRPFPRARHRRRMGSRRTSSSSKSAHPACCARTRTAYICLRCGHRLRWVPVTQALTPSR